MIKSFLRIYLDGLAPIVPLLILLTGYKTFQLKGKVFVLLFFIISTIGFLTTDYIDHLGDNNLLVYNIIPLFFVVNLYFFFRIIHINPVIRNINTLMLICLVVLYFYRKEYILEYKVFGSPYYIMFSIFTLVNCLGYYYQEFIAMGEIVMWRKLEFWFIASILFYASTSFVIWGFFKMLMDKGTAIGLNKKELKYIGDLWQLHNVVFTISCLGFFGALIWKRFKIKF